MEKKVSLSADELMRQAPLTIEYHLPYIIDMLDKQFGKDYAKNNPELVGTLIHTCVYDTVTALLISCLEDGLENIAGGIVAISDELRD